MPQRTKTDTFRAWRCPVCKTAYVSPINIRGYVCGNSKGHPTGKPKVAMEPEE